MSFCFFLRLFSALTLSYISHFNTKRPQRDRTHGKISQKSVRELKTHWKCEIKLKKDDANIIMVVYGYMVFHQLIHGWLMCLHCTHSHPYNNIHQHIFRLISHCHFYFFAVFSLPTCHVRLLLTAPFEILVVYGVLLVVSFLFFYSNFFVFILFNVAAATLFVFVCSRKKRKINVQQLKNI